MTRASPIATAQSRVFAVAAGLFAVWGMALWLYNALFFKFTQFFVLSPVQVAWTLALFHIVYVGMAIPAVLFHRQFGYKLGVLLGLSVFCSGAFLLYLAIAQHSSLYFVAAVVVVGSCGVWLDTALNPLVVVSGDQGSAVKRLSFAHAVNGMGLFAAYFSVVTLLGPDYQLSSGITGSFPLFRDRFI